MTILELHLDEKTVAQQRQTTLAALVANVIDTLAAQNAETDPWWGMFADEPEIVDQVITSVMEARERDRVRGQLC